MTETIQKSDFNVKEGRTIITVPHLKDKVDFHYPAFKGNYADISNQIKEAGLIEPTPEQTASLIYSAHMDQEEKHAYDLTMEMRESLFYMYNTPNSEPDIRYVPNEGAFIKKLSEEGKEKEIFVPFGYELYYQSPLEFSRNEFVIALFGGEGADKLAKVADKYSMNPYIYGYKNLDHFKKRKYEVKEVSSLHVKYRFDHGFCISGCRVIERNGHVLGVVEKEAA